jgi:hypothetical protein
LGDQREEEKQTKRNRYWRGELLKPSVPSSFLAVLAKIRMFTSVELIIELQLLKRRM